MFRKVYKIIIVVILSILLLLGLIMFGAYRFYNSIFRLSYEQVYSVVNQNPTECKKFVECKLIPGDIIIRRYITNVSELFSTTLDPYFTHAVFYLGNDEIFEALGDYGKPDDQIIITKLSDSDWYNKDMNDFVILRPKNYYGKLDEVILDLKNIANDPEYKFGPIREGKKTVSCSDIILKNLVDKNIINALPKTPKIITPDYLFWSIQSNQLNSEIVGYNINPKI